MKVKHKVRQKKPLTGEWKMYAAVGELKAAADMPEKKSVDQAPAEC